MYIKIGETVINISKLNTKIQNFNKTALVLAEENLLSLTLNSLPHNVDSINITMGYPLKDIPIASLFEKLFKLHLNQQKFSNTAIKFYYKDKGYLAIIGRSKAIFDFGWFTLNGRVG